MSVIENRKQLYDMVDGLRLGEGWKSQVRFDVDGDDEVRLTFTYNGVLSVASKADLGEVAAELRGLVAGMREHIAKLAAGKR